MWSWHARCSISLHDLQYLNKAARRLFPSIGLKAQLSGRFSDHMF